MRGIAVLTNENLGCDRRRIALEAKTMINAKVSGVRSSELGVTDLKRSAAFYNHIWGLEPVSTEGDTIHLRANGSEHHIVTLRERPRAGLLGVHFAASDRGAVDALHAKAKAFGVTITSAPGDLPASAGGGYGFGFRSPEGHSLNISSDVASQPNVVSDRSKPVKLSHIVLNSAKIADETKFFIDVLGFKWSDSTQMMDFVRCCSDHHSIAVARGSGPNLNHMAFEMDNIDGLMRGAGRMKHHGFNIEWGVGRHGPGDNVFSYFVEPNGFVVEYTTEIQQVDESTYMPNNAEYWANFPGRPCRWGMATHPSNRVRAAMGGDTSVADPEAGKRCEEIMAQTLGR
jgi:catechol 2,3-dioxygenase-like lactoylglutathione lyase family enzyme